MGTAEIMQIIGIGLVASVLSVFLKAYKPEMSVQITIVAGVIIFFLIASRFSAIVKIIEIMANRVNLDIQYIQIILKVIGIAYVAKFASQVCSDAGEGAIAAKIDFAGKIAVILAASPIILGLMDLLLKMI